MKKNQLCQVLLIVAISLFMASNLSAQVTTATLSGVVKDSKGTALASATITVEFADAGIKHVLTTKDDGRFTLPNLRVGGPYKITVNHVSHQQSVTDNVFLEWRMKHPVDGTMQEVAIELTGVTVAAGGGSRIFDE